MTRSLIFLIFLSLLPQSLWAAPFLSHQKNGAIETLTLNVGASEPQKVFFLDDPDRLVVDVPLSSLPAVTQPESALIKAVRIARFNPDTVRIVFDLSGPAKIESQHYANPDFTLTLSGGKGKNATLTKSAAAPKKVQKPLIVLDPGHGGQDPGAIGPRGNQEKDIVLAYAMALEDALERSGKYRVTLTRDNDKFIPLRGRVKIARDAGASLFISIHADSAPNDESRGLSVYTLSEQASDAEAAALAAHENKADVIGGMDLSHEDEAVADILISLAQRDTRNQSGLLADLLAESLRSKVKLLNNPHRFAGFAVLKGPDIPAVLVETGFISHPAEERLLTTKDYRTKLISGMVNGIDRFFERQGITPQ